MFKRYPGYRLHDLFLARILVVLIEVASVVLVLGWRVCRVRFIYTAEQAPGLYTSRERHKQLMLHAYRRGHVTSVPCECANSNAEPAQMCTVHGMLKLVGSILP